ncbi:putative plant non-specific lipid-transfer protein/Par allergen [Dioscorea sansibarensis]
MAGMKVSVCMVALMVVCMAAGWPKGEGSVTCGSVVSCLAPCMSYARGSGPLTQSCCAGVKKLNDLAGTTADRKAACTCLKTIGAGLKNANWGAIEKVPAQCRVNVPYKISPSTDCSRVR